METPTTLFAHDPAVLLARRACWRFSAMALADPRTGVWNELANPATADLVTQAAEIIREAGHQFDPKVVDAFLRLAE